MDKQSANPITKAIIDGTQTINVNLPSNIEDKWAEVETLEIKLAIQTAELGYRYMDLQETLGHGEFLKELEFRGLSKSRVYRYMDIAKFFLNSPSANFPTLGSLKPSQVIELTKLPEPKKQELTPENIEDFGKMPVRQLASAIKQIKAEFETEKKLEDEVATLKHKVQELDAQRCEAITELNREQLKHEPVTKYGLSPAVAFIKEQVPKLTETVHLAGLDILNLVSQATSPRLPIDEKDQALKALHTFLAGPYKQLGLAMERLQSHAEETGIELGQGLPAYGEEEWKEADSLRQQVVMMYTPVMGRAK